MAEKKEKIRIPEVSVMILEDGITVKGTVTSLKFVAFLVGPSKRFTKESLEEIRVDMQSAWEEKILDVAAEVLRKHGEGVMPLIRRLDEDG